AAGLGSAGFVASAAYLITLAVDRGFSLEAAGLLMSVVSMVSILSRLIGGLVTDRYAVVPLTLVAGLMVVGGLSCVVLATIPRSSGAFVLAALGLGATAWAWNGLFHYAIARDFPQDVARATGITQMGMLTGG